MANYKDVIRSDLSFISFYKTYTPIVEDIIEKLEGTKITGVQTGAYVKTSRESILVHTADFYSSLPGEYPTLYKQFKSDPRNVCHYYRLRKGEPPHGDTTSIYGTNNSILDIGFNNTFEDYTTSIHEHGHGIALMLNQNQFYDIEKYCIAETDANFLEMIGNDFTAKKFGLEQNAIDTSLDILDDNLGDATIIYSKLYMYMNTSFKWTRTNIENYFREHGYKDDELDDCIGTYLKDCFHYLIAYLNAIELYLIYRQDKKEALDICLRIVKASDMHNSKYLEYVKSLGIVPGKNIQTYLKLLQERDMVLGNGKRLQYKIK